MKKKITIKENYKQIKKYKNRFLKQKPFPPLPKPSHSQIQPVLHTGRLIFIRGKFLFLGMLKALEDKDMYVFYAIIKSFWENVAALGYYYLRISKLLKENKKVEALRLAKKIGLGGRGFPTKEMVEKKGATIDEYTLPHIYTMMDLVDKDFNKKAGISGRVLRDFYDEQIAEGGHTTYTGLIIAGRWSPDKKSLLPDLNKKWERKDKASLVNLIAMGALVFFYYWDKFEKL